MPRASRSETSDSEPKRLIATRLPFRSSSFFDLWIDHQHIERALDAAGDQSQLGAFRPRPDGGRRREAGDTDVAGKQSLDDQRAARHVDKLRFELILFEQSGALAEIERRLKAGDRDVGNFEV